MARRRDRPPSRLNAPAARPPIEREFSAGGLVYRRRAGAVSVVLAARRHAERDVLLWTIPKGHLEPGESSETAAIREVREETGLAAAVDRKLGDVTYFYVRRDEAGRPIRVLKRVRFFLMRYQGGRFADRDHEMDAVRWFPPEEAETIAAYDNEQALLRRARELLATV